MGSYQPPCVPSRVLRQPSTVRQCMWRRERFLWRRMRRNALGKVAMTIGASLLLCACDTAREPVNATVLLVTSRDSAGIRLIELSQTPNEVASGETAASELFADLSLGHAGDPVAFGAAVDVTSLGSAGFAVLDRIENAVVILDASGRLRGRLGGTGDGPGEFRVPWALEAVGERLVVWQNRPSSTFTVFDASGKVTATAGREVQGDWERPRYRKPRLDLLGMGEQHGPEDVTRRLQAIGDTAFAFLLQMDEFAAADLTSPTSFRDPPAHLLAYDMSAHVKDTITEITGTPTLLREVVPGMTVLFEQPLFVARPVWATGDGWIAMGHGLYSEVVVRRLDGDPVAVVRWPKRVARLRDEDRLDAAKWVVAFRILDSSESRRMFERDSRRERQKGIEWEAFDLLPFADTVATVSAAYGAGDCLFLAGHAATDWADGTALTWIVLNVARGTLEAVIRIRPQSPKPPLELDRIGAAVKDIDGRYVYTITRDGDGVFLVERYPLPDLSCGT